jgi:histone H3/H4
MVSAELGLAAVYRLIKSAGAERVGDDAAAALRESLEQIGRAISKRAVELATHANRKTIKSSDIKLAEKQVLQS